MVDFLLLYENKNREIESLVLLKCLLVRKGYSVKIQNIHYYYERKINARVVCTPFAYSDDDLYQYVYCICGKSQKIINFRWEQIYSRKNEMNLGGFFYPKGEAKKLIQLCWGEKQCKRLIDAGVKKFLVYKVGPVHLDLIKKDGYFQGKDIISNTYHISSERPWVLFVSSFSNATFTDVEKREAINKLGKDRIDFIDISEKSRKTILNWLIDICKKGYEVIYRPHPSEKLMKDLEDFERNDNNFHVIMDDSVGQWISCCDYVFNWYSTSAIQSIVLGKGNVILRPYEIEYSTDVEIFTNAKKLTSFEEVVSYLDGVNKHNQDPVIDSYYDFKSPACYRIIDVFENLYDGEDIMGIDYKSVLASVGIKKRIKYEFLYKFYVPLLFLMSQLDVSNKHKTNYEMIKRNRVSDAELRIMENRMERLLV